MVLYTIKSVLSIKDIVKTLPSNGNNNYIKMQKSNVLENNSEGTQQKYRIDRIVLKKVSLVLHL